MRNPGSFAALLLVAAQAQGQITFEPPISITHMPDVGVFGAYSVDIDGDGTEEVVLPPSLLSHTTSLEVIDVDGEGQLSISPFATTNGGVPTEITRSLGFFDNDADGDMDILHAGPFLSPYIEVYRTLDPSSANVVQVLPFTPEAEPVFNPRISMGDVTGDGLSDALVSYSLAFTFFGQSELALFEGRPDGTFITGTAPQTDTIDHHVKSFNEDLNGDGVNDVLIIGSLAPSAVVTWMSQGDGAFAPPVTSFPGLGTPLHFISSQLIDITADGQPDLVTNSNGTLFVAPGHADGTFAPVAITPGVPLVSSYDFMHLDDNAASDLVIRESYESGAANSLDELFILPNQCNGSFAHEATIIEPGVGVHAADVDGNGLDDLVLLNSATGEVRVRRTLMPGYSPFSSVGGGSDNGPTLTLFQHKSSVSVFVDRTITGEGYIFVGTQAMNRELYGATLVPDPIWSSGPREITGSNGWDVVWPALETLPPGATLWVQAWVAGETTDDIVASNAVQISVP